MITKDNKVIEKKDNKVEIKLNENDVEEIKNEVMEELKKIGSKVIPSVYNGKKEILKKFVSFSNYIKKYNEDKAKIKDRYRDSVATEKIRDLDIDFMTEKMTVKEDLDRILKREVEYKEKAIKDNISLPEYKEARKEALDILLRLGDKLDANITFDIIKPIVEAKDLTTIKILKETANRNTEFLYIGAIRQVEEYLNTSELSNIINVMKNYIDSNLKGKRSYALECFIYENDIELYKSLPR